MSTRNEYGFSTDYEERKNQPIVTGVLDYFPLAILAIAEVSNDGNAQHNPGQPLHWAREKSQDEINTALRHLLEREKMDGSVRHLAKAAWRLLAALQKEIEADLCTDPDCEIHVHNQDRGGVCKLLPRAATWYGRTRNFERSAKGSTVVITKPGLYQGMPGRVFAFNIRSSLPFRVELSNGSRIDFARSDFSLERFVDEDDTDHDQGALGF